MDDKSFRIRLATADDFLNVQLCARAAYATYVERINREPAPIAADFAYQIALGQVYVARCASSFVVYVVFYHEADHLHLENVAVVP